MMGNLSTLAAVAWGPVILVWWFGCHPVVAMLPPPLRNVMDLQKDCQQRCINSYSTFVWEVECTKPYQAATATFRELADRSSAANPSYPTILWFPSLENGDKLVGRLADVLNKNSELLPGFTSASASNWPTVPATCLRLDFDGAEQGDENNPTDQAIQDAIKATESWVDDTLCRLKLCPYTASLTRGAVGLEAAKVQEGPVVVKHASQSYPKAPSAASAMAATFWDGVSTLAEQMESRVATLLLVAPPSYDKNFPAFSTLCDNLIEPSFRAVEGATIAGRAWFHPRYNSATVGHKTLLPGHAIPPNMVEHFMEVLDLPEQQLPGKKDITRANDAVRHTPHATINLLRRSQLTAATELEKQATVKKPNLIYAKNVMRILDDEKQEQSTG